MEFELEHQGLLEWDVVSELDYLMWSTNPLEIPMNPNIKNFFYNQWTLQRTKNACVLFSNAASLWYLMNYEFTVEELLEIVDLAEAKYWRKEDKWMYISKWVDCVRHYWNNKYPDRKVKTFRMTIGDKDFTEALNMNHRLVVWYRTSREYYKDAQSDWIVDWEIFTDHSWWHAVSSMYGIAEVISTDKWILIQDNYRGSKPFNIYYNNKISKLKDTGTFFPSAYLYLKDNTMTDTIKANIDLELARDAFDLWLFNWLDPRGTISRQENAVMELRTAEKMLKFFNKINNTNYTLKDFIDAVK